ncbi:MAG TPA: FIST N-terminal domain-containing protein, partial [Magnetospirillum sp.]|nr:FIST N-terminal domain-containing protein [Magnetospirillum sp.]
MQIAQHAWTKAGGWNALGGTGLAEAQLVFYFAAPDVWQAAAPHAHLSALYPGAHIVGCTTGGEILGEDVYDHSIAATAIRFDAATVAVATAEVAEASQSQAGGRALAQALPQAGLRAVFVLADGMRTNGSALIAGLREILPEGVVITGGLAGDGPDFRATYVGCDAAPRQGLAVAVGLYGQSLRIGWGSFGGWERFGPERQITRAAAN